MATRRPRRTSGGTTTTRTARTRDHSRRSRPAGRDALGRHAGVDLWRPRRDSNSHTRLRSLIWIGPRLTGRRGSVKTRSPSTVGKVHRVLSLIVNMAVKEGRLARNVATGVNLPRPTKEEQRFLTHAQVEALA
jgi:hypothetical protein